MQVGKTLLTWATDDGTIRFLCRDWKIHFMCLTAFYRKLNNQSENELSTYSYRLQRMKNS